MLGEAIIELLPFVEAAANAEKEPTFPVPAGRIDDVLIHSLNFTETGQWSDPTAFGEW